MTKTSALILAVLLTSLAMPAGAAARPALSIPAAERAAHHEIALAAEEINANTEAPEPTITGSTFYDCDPDGNYRALCDYTFRWSDGVSCDDTLLITESNPTGRHEHLWVRSLTEWAPAESECYPTDSS